MKVCDDSVDFDYIDIQKYVEIHKDVSTPIPGTYQGGKKVLKVEIK